MLKSNEMTPIKVKKALSKEDLLEDDGVAEPIKDNMMIIEPKKFSERSKKQQVLTINENLYKMNIPRSKQAFFTRKKHIINSDL